MVKESLVNAKVESEQKQLTVSYCIVMTGDQCQWWLPLGL